jgi:hypothetical protein
MPLHAMCVLLENFSPIQRLLHALIAKLVISPMKRKRLLVPFALLALSVQMRLFFLNYVKMDVFKKTRGKLSARSVNLDIFKLLLV